MYHFEALVYTDQSILFFENHGPVPEEKNIKDYHFHNGSYSTSQR